MGVISGYVTRRDGSPYSGVRVCASVPGFGGGVTQEVRTDGQGHFILRWTSSSGSVETVYVNGQAVDHNVSSGSTRYYQA
jgi:hypothetical protein